jgi:hypothetical protein
MKTPVRLFYRIITAGMKWMTFQKPQDSVKDTFYETVFFKCLL